MSVNLITNFSFEQGLAGWNTSGGVDAESITAAYEQATVAQFGPLLLPPADDLVLSQMVRVPPGATHFHVVYAIRQPLVELGDFRVEVEFRGSANLDPPLPLRRRDVIDILNTNALVSLTWQTRYAVTGEIPPNTEWARLRFIRPASLALGALQIDAVYMTTD